MYRCNFRNECAVIVHVVDVGNVNTTSRGTLLHQRREQVDGRDRFLTDALVGFVLQVQLFELVLINKERVVQARHIVWAEQRNVFVAHQAAIHQTVNHHAIVEMTNTVLFNATVVFQYQQTFNFQVPDRIERCSSAAANTALRAGFHSCLEVFQERNNASVGGLAIADLTSQRTQTPKANTNSRAT
ncbi:Uncharacterised protein [Salmonella enterica subsp. enterica serovar Typhi]|nr:Uncharacterised protein [Salmonella enterica subsp. enterica serovar Typhi]CHL14922.1 Uncharacterised protein [Salmonella enterica subsp. enterica serovar Typhi]CHL15596.1 Uncharacterised protein [Salmonella enterica subsp. enterica serovar Typhi]CHL33826.1 Uncharacterised protein [Salmonella enterica subsp. enterica serovar Typhi]CRK09385.1 Uncharacterised protein [Salmonella enterica subsp. enterica serovar Typhi]